jgi:arylsulfatase A-like enzyme
MIGKWHLGDRSPYLPNDLGFDFFFGAHYSNDMTPYHLWKNKQIALKAPLDQNQLTKILNEQAVNFIKDHVNERFFLYYAEPLPHHPLHASEEFRGQSQAGLYGDAVEEIDWSVGKIVQELKDQGLYENTLIIFTSDNGPWHEGNPGYHRGRKHLPFEGGVKVPMVASWPNKFSSNLVNESVIINLDFLPTVLSFIDIKLPLDRIIDGQDMSSNWTLGTEINPDRPIYYFFDKNLQAIRMGTWKYHIKHTSDNSAYLLSRPGPFLFDLTKDPNESYDQITHYPNEAKLLSEKLKKMNNELQKNLRGWQN